MWSWIGIGVLYAFGMGLFHWLGGVAGAADAIKRWGHATGARRRGRRARIRRIADPRVPRVRAWAVRTLLREFGGAVQARRGELIDVLGLPGFVAERDGEPVGLATYRLELELRL